MHVIREHFTSIHQMLSIIENRPNNKVMSYKHSSSEKDKEFTGTDNYTEAKDLFQNGYTDILDQIKSGIAKSSVSQTVSRRRVNTGVVGYAPHVPNAILGLPNSMIYTQSEPQKIKAVSIVYDITENCGTKTEEFIKSGIAVLNVINRLELQGIRVNLKIAFYYASADNERAFGTVSVKDYREHMDIQKLCFPVAHPSMFRRFGFRWIETVPDMQSNDWNHGYGRHADADDPYLKKELKENEFFINLSYTKKFGYDADEIIKNLKL